jgi:hypothetical protein
MLYVIATDNKTSRGTKILEVVSAHEHTERIVLDDSMMTLQDLEQFLYPSLFSQGVSLVHGKFFLDRGDFDEGMIKKFVMSPTVFIFEELALPKQLATTLTKSGAVVHLGEKQPAPKKEGDIFAVTACITAKDKKARWIAYRTALETQPIEALLGILFWKLRTLAVNGAKGNQYEQLYKAMLGAQKRAWQTGAPLDALVEKIILE